MKKPIFKILATALALVMLFSVIPFSTFADTVDYVEEAGDYYKVVSKKDWDLAPGIVESEIVLNNAAGSHRQVAHVVEVDIHNEYTKVIPSYKGMTPTPGNYGVQIMAKQAAFAEANGYGNVVAAMNISLSWYDSAYYKAHPELVGEPLGYMVLDGVQYTNSQGKTAGAQTCLVINFDEKDGVARPADIPKTQIRSTADPITGWEEQVIPANFGFLVKDGKNLYTENHTTDAASRSFVGIKADGTIVMVMNDGRQVPFSAGFNSYEMADFMISLGCVYAINGDGGGSSQFLSQRPGEELELHCSPSDGAERETTHGILVISTAPATGEFVRASIEAPNAYYTPGSSVQFTAVGSDLVGTPADIPADAVWQLADPSMGTIKDGLFVSNGKVGTAVAQLVYNGAVVGEGSVEIVVPTEFSFVQGVMTVPFGKTVAINLKATINGGLQDVVIKPEDITFSTNNAALGTINGFEFTSVSEENAPANLNSTLTAKLNCANITATAALNLGKGSEILFDFEDPADMNKWSLGWLAGGANEPYTVLEHVTSETGRVFRGNGAMSFSCDTIAGGTVSGSWVQAEIRPATGEEIYIENAKSIGFWMYMPDEFTNLAIRIFYYYPVGDGTEKIAIAQPIVQPYTYNELEESGWYFVSTDISAYSYIKFKGDKYFAEIMLAPATAAGMPSGVGTVTGPLNIYIDDITVDYSDAVDDREAPIFGDVTLNTSAENYVAMNKHGMVEITNNILNVSAGVAENTAKINATGIDASSAKAYIDGVEVEASFKNGRIAINNIAVADGVHRVKFEIADNMGNKAVVIRLVNVKSGVDASTVQLVPRNASLDRLYGGSVYWMDLKATDIETIQSVTAVIDLNVYNHWELAHMELADGFTAEYTVYEKDNTATITFTRTGENTKVGEAVIASLPIRTAYFDTDFKVSGYTAETYWKNFDFWPIDLKVDVDFGEITYVDGYTSNVLNTFSNEAFRVDSEMYTIGKLMDGAFKAERGTAHVHTAAALKDLAATCLKDGYTGRTYCDVCDSVVDWGTTVPATGHNWVVNAEGKLACQNNGELFNGIFTDGKEYIDGVIVPDGWTADGTAYYVDGVKLTGSNFIDGKMFTFDENGTYLPDYKYNGFFEINDTIMYFENNEYKTGCQWIETIFYNFHKNGMAYDGVVELCGTECLFEDGQFVSAEGVLLAGTCGDDVYYVIYADGRLVLDGTGPMMDFLSLGMNPWWRQEYRMNVKKIIIGNGITQIGERAFVNTYATEVVFEEGSQLTTLNKNAFAVMDKLTTITFPESLKTLNYRSLYDCSILEHVYLPANVTYIAPSAFEASPKVTVHFPETSKYLAGRLTELGIKYDAYPCVIESGACGENATWEFYSNGVLKINGSGAMADYAEGTAPWNAFREDITSIVVSKDITAIGAYSFYGCANVTAVDFEEGTKLEAIGNGAFENAGVQLIVVPVYNYNGNVIKYIICNDGELIDESALPAIPERLGYTFTGWANLDNPAAYAASGIVATYEKDTTTEYGVVANPEAEVEVEVKLPAGQEKVYYNDRVTLSAPAMNGNGQKFAYWMVNGSKFSYMRTISFLAFDELEITPVYAAETEENPVVIYTNANKNFVMNGNKWNLQVMGVVDAGGNEVTEIGILLSASEMTAEELKAGYEANNGTVYKMVSSATNGRQFLYTVKNIATNRTRCATVYAIVNGELVVGDAVTCVTVE